MDFFFIWMYNEHAWHWFIFEGIATATPTLLKEEKINNQNIYVYDVTITNFMVNLYLPAKCFKIDFSTTVCTIAMSMTTFFTTADILTCFWCPVHCTCCDHCTT